MSVIEFIPMRRNILQSGLTEIAIITHTERVLLSKEINGFVDKIFHVTLVMCVFSRVNLYKCHIYRSTPHNEKYVINQFVEVIHLYIPVSLRH